VTRITPVFLLLSIACAPTAPAVPQVSVMEPLVISDSAARGVVGRSSRVMGLVVQVKDHAHHGFAYLNFGARYPDMTFSVLVPDSAAARFGDLSRFEGHRAVATGSVWLQDGRTPAMTVSDPADLVLIP
jgi:hypothetical protein